MDYIPKEEQRVEFYFDDTKREALDKFKSDFGTLASNKNLKKLNIDRFINYENNIKNFHMKLFMLRNISRNDRIEAKRGI